MDNVADNKAGLDISSNGRVSRLKWHCLRRTGSDPAFSTRRLNEGLKAGASMEIDLRKHGGNDFILMHDATLERETNGLGAVGSTSVEELRKLYMRCPDGSVSDERPIFFEELSPLFLPSIHDKASLQIDIKEQAKSINDQLIRRFLASVTDIERYCVLSGDDWQAVQLLASCNSNLALGFDTDALTTTETEWSGEQLLDFVGRTLNEAGKAEWIYLRLSIILRARKLDLDIVELFHQANKKVDTWTFNPEIPDAFNILREIVSSGVDQITTDNSVTVQKMAGDLRL